MVLEIGVKNIQATAYNGAHTVISFGEGFCPDFKSSLHYTARKMTGQWHIMDMALKTPILQWLPSAKKFAQAPSLIFYNCF